MSAQNKNDVKRLMADRDRLREANRELLAALKKAAEDTNWMLNNQKLLNPSVFDYLFDALAKHGEGK